MYCKFKIKKVIETDPVDLVQLLSFVNNLFKGKKYKMIAYEPNETSFIIEDITYNDFIETCKKNIHTYRITINEIEYTNEEVIAGEL